MLGNLTGGFGKEVHLHQLKNCGLPAPNWSPTGEEGYWVWRNEKWSWLTDEEYETLKGKEQEE
jgi:hypothetical protein